MDARAAEDKLMKRRRVDPYWVEPVRLFLSAHDVHKVNVCFRQNDVEFFVCFNTSTLKVDVEISEEEGDDVTITTEDEFVIKYCLARVQSQHISWHKHDSKAYSSFINNPPFRLVKNETGWVFVNTEVPKKYSLANRDASIRSFLKTNELDDKTIIELKLPDVSYYVCLNHDGSGIKKKSKFTRTTKYEPNVFWVMNEKGWEKSIESIPQKITFTIEKKKHDYIYHKDIVQPPVKPTFTQGNTYLLPKDVEKFVRECVCTDIVSPFTAFNGVLIDIEYKHGIDQSIIEKTYDLKPGFLPLPFDDIQRKETAKNGTRSFVISNPLTENEIQFICCMLRVGFYTFINLPVVWVVFSGPDEWEHYALRYGV